MYNFYMNEHREFILFNYSFLETLISVSSFSSFSLMPTINSFRIFNKCCMCIFNYLPLTSLSCIEEFFRILSEFKCAHILPRSQL